MAALTGGFAEDIIRAAVTTHQLTAITSEAILTELQQKLQDKFNWSSEDIDRFLTRIRKIAEIVEINIKVNDITRDPDDNKILECAIAGNAEWTFPAYFKKRKLPT